MSYDRTHVEAVLLATSLFILLATAGAIALAPPDEDATTTELALVDEDGTASGYPTTLAVGETGRTVVAVTNNADEARQFTVVATFDGTTVSSGTVTVAANSRRAFPVAFTADGPAGRKPFVVRLWTGTDTEGPPDRRVQLWVTVGESDG